MLNLIKIKEDLKQSLSTYRYEHSIRVAEEAKKLAKHYGENEYDAYLAGLLHDIAKEFSDDKIKHYLKKYNLSNDLLDKENRRVSHSFKFVESKSKFKYCYINWKHIYDSQQYKSEFVKDYRRFLTYADFPLIPKEWVDGLRLTEQPADINRDGAVNFNDSSIQDYALRLMKMDKYLTSIKKAV